MGKPEAKIENYLVRQAKKHGYLCLKFVSPGTDGVPDRILIGNGQTCFVETKAPGEKLRRLQEVICGEMQTHGANVYALDTIEKIDRFFTDRLTEN